MRNIHVLQENIYITSDEVIEGNTYVINIVNGSIYKTYRGTDFDDVNDTENEKWRKIILTTDQDLIKYGVQAIDDEFLEWFVKNLSCESVEVVFNNRGITGTEKILKTFGEYKIIIPKEKAKQEGYICPHTLLQCDDECCVSAEDCHIKESIGILSDKQETLEEAIEQYSEIYRCPATNKNEYCRHDIISAVKFGAKWQQERSYSEEEVYHILCEHTAFLFAGGKSTLTEWFEQFKK
jgi:hypothetical protein